MSITTTTPTGVLVPVLAFGIALGNGGLVYKNVKAVTVDPMNAEYVDLVPHTATNCGAPGDRT